MSLRYEQGEMFFGSVRLADLAARYSTPYYAYDLDGIQERLNLFLSAFSLPVEAHFAMKANAHPLILRQFQRNNIGVDVVSGGEIQNALAAGFAGKKIIFSGVGKTVAEIDQALAIGVGQINVESVPELIRISERARQLKKIAPIAFRMNPDVDAQTHPYITTGFRENKFGLADSELPELLRIVKANPSLKLQGLTLHIGSQLQDLAPIQAAVEKVITIFQTLRKQGFPLETFDAGGGLGIDYTDLSHKTDAAFICEYGKMLSTLLKPINARILLEPGRILVAPFGVLVAEVQYVKSTPYKKFIIVNTGIHHLLRPALYQAFHGIYPLLEKANLAKSEYDIVGPICESSDVVGRKRMLPEVQQGDFLAIADVGAYGFTMATVYNEHKLPAQLILQNGSVIATDLN